MKTSKIISVSLFASVGFWFGCGGDGTEKDNLVKIEVNVGDSLVSNFKLTRFNLSNDTTIANVKLDSVGHAKMLLPISAAGFYYFVIDRELYEMYLSPNDDLQLNIKKTKAGLSIAYSGKGSEVNNYLTQRRVTVENVKSWKRNPIFQLEPEDFFKKIDSLSSVLEKMRITFTDTVTLSPPVDLLNKMDKTETAGLRLEYAFLKQNSLVEEQFQAMQNGEPVPSPIVQEYFKTVVSGFPFIPELLEVGNGSYKATLFYYLNYAIYNPSYDVRTWDKVKTVFPVKAEKLILSEKHPPAIEEYLLATNVNYWMSIFGIKNTSVDSIYSYFKNRYDHSHYSYSLDAQYAKWDSLSVGKPAPLFAGVFPDDSKFSLSDFKGKAVYIDIWATWCKPCLKEIPFSKKLQKKYNGNDDIVFLYVSVDRDKEAWKKKILDDKDWNGEHILNNGSIYKSYLISGIPRYILIDKEGKIVNSDAPRPSSQEMESEINKLLR